MDIAMIGLGKMGGKGHLSQSALAGLVMPLYRPPEYHVERNGKT